MADLPALPAELVEVEPPIARDLDDAILTAALAGHYTEDGYEPDPDDEHANAVVRVFGWYPSTLDEAEWCARKLAAVQARDREIEAQYEAWLEPLKRWREKERERLEPAAAFFTSRLRTFGLAMREIDPKDGKTTRLPSGEIKTRHADRKVEVADPQAVIAWASESLTGDEYEQIVKTEPAVKLADLRKAVEVRERPPVLEVWEWTAVLGIRILDRDTNSVWSQVPADARMDEGEFRLIASLSQVEMVEPMAPVPESTWIVVHPGTGEVVPGLSLTEPETTASVTVR
jgi:hypothetical protein